MKPFRLNKAAVFSCLLLLLKAVGGQAQEAINNVALEKVSATSFKVRYKLNALAGSDFKSVNLKIYRRRDEKVEEVFSNDITPPRLVANQTYAFIWNTNAGMVKDGDELQAKVLVSYSKPAVVDAAPPPPANLPPRADAGGDINIQLPLNLVVILDGMRSYDEDGRIVSVSWRQLSGPNTLKIASPSSYKSYVVGEFKAGVYTFELSVTDDKAGRSTDTVTITAKGTTVSPQTEAAVKKKDSGLTRPVIAKYEMPELKGGPDNAFLSILLPGLGHYFVSGDHYGNDRKPQVLLITALYAGSVGGAVYYKLKSNREYNKYVELSNFREYQKDDNGNIIGVRGANQAQATQYLSDARNSHNNFLILTGISAGIMAADAVYTFVKGSKNKKAWEEEARGTTRLFVSPSGTGLALGVRVKL